MWISALAADVARLIAVANPSSFGASPAVSVAEISRSTASIAIALAISPAAAPPIPSATMKSVPRSPTTCERTSGWSVALPRVRSATTNASSLCSRILPTSVRPNTWTTTSSDVDGIGCSPVGTGVDELTRSPGTTLEKSRHFRFVLRSPGLLLHSLQHLARSCILVPHRVRPHLHQPERHHLRATRQWQQTLRFLPRRERRRVVARLLEQYRDPRRYVRHRLRRRSGRRGRLVAPRTCRTGRHRARV